jgi:hypothetical protein
MMARLPPIFLPFPQFGKVSRGDNCQPFIPFECDRSRTEERRLVVQRALGVWHLLTSAPLVRREFFGRACAAQGHSVESVASVDMVTTYETTREGVSMNKKNLLALVSVLVMTGMAVNPAAAVTDGVPDGDGHPYVGLMVEYDQLGAALWRCSGTLLSPTVFLTAGHCTEGPAVSAQVWFDADVQSLDVCFDGTIGEPCYPYGGGDSHMAASIHVHPDFYTASFVVHDVGVVVLDAPVVMSMYGALPSVNQLDGLKTRRGQQNVTFTAVGYGLQKSFPDEASFLAHNVKVRMVANPKLNQINVPGFTGDFSMLLSNNAHTGGTCFGDSGGPNFLGNSNVVAGVTSFGINGNCAGTGGVFRMDRQNVLDWVNTFL